MDQPVPQVSEADVTRIVARDFPPDQVAAVQGMLTEYGTKDWHREVPRVRLAILKLANGDYRKLSSALKTADQDYRDVLSYAEYPGYFAAISPSEPDPATRARAVIPDWEQYRAWLNRK
jgi:hypothetical protein